MTKLYAGNSLIEGKGIFANEDIQRGKHIAFVEGTYRRKISKNATDASSIPLWYGITKTLWLDPGKTIWRYFNHSCSPNTAIIGTKKVIALQNIKKDTELTFDYSMTDGDLYWKMECRCGNKNCRKEITSIQKLPKKVFDKHMPFIPKYFIQLRKQYQKSVNI